MPSAKSSKADLRTDANLAIEALEECRRLREVVAELSGGMRLLAEEADQNHGHVEDLARQLHAGADHGKAALDG